MSFNLPPRLASVLAVIAAILGATALTFTLTDDNGDGTPDRVTVTVNQAEGDGHPTTEVTAPAPAVKAAEPLLEDDLAQPPANAPAPTAAEQAHAERLEGSIEARGPPLEPAGAVQGFAGCVTRILPVNFSSRNGTRPIWQVLHYTVSFNRPGWDDVNAIISLFSSPARQASSNFVIDAEAHCAYIVPIEAKAWTQARGNPWSVSYEIVAFGNESAYLPPVAMAKLKSVMRQVSQRTGIPLRRGSVTSSGLPGSAGVVQHKDGGLSWGGHVDITPFPTESIIRELTSGASPTLTAAELKVVKAVRRPKGTGHSHRYWCRRLGTALVRIRAGDGHRRPARRKIIRRVWIASCT